MSDADKPKPAKTRQKNSTKLRDSKIRVMSIGGMTNSKIAEEMDMDRHEIGRILSNEETRRIVREAESEVVGLIMKSIRRVEAAIDNELDGTNSLKAALAVLKSKGVIVEKVEMSHTFPKPTIIVRPSGQTVILGHEIVNDD